MLFVIIGVLFMLLNFLGIGPFGAWTWEIGGDLWKFCAPFVLAVIWWIWSDVSGLNKRREIDRMDKKKADRRLASMAALGMDPESRRRGRKR